MDAFDSVLMLENGLTAQDVCNFLDHSLSVKPD